jgi:prolyl 4-hydroxylase
MRLKESYPVGVGLAADPIVWVIDDFLSSDERSEIVEIARPRLEAAKVTSTKVNTTSAARTGSVAWVRYADSPTVTDVVNRVSELVDIPVHHSESMQVVHYAETQEYRPHFDGWDLSTEKGRLRTENGGQRVLTALMYLNEPDGGGGTSFPKLELEVEAKPGRLVIFHNIADDETNLHPHSLHGGMPVGEGEKWACNLWFRARPYRTGESRTARAVAPSSRTGGGGNRAARRRRR